MENYIINLGDDKPLQRFQVIEYPYRDGETCKYNVFQNGILVVSFKPDSQNHLHLCQNPGRIAKELLDLLAEAIELKHPTNII
ncbi:hypothetical protein [Pedobacter aquatilis]|uniref:hypothetical protein n=1 Tax=Pedobacter aquatilis TaxID=351343 RepID=UPI0029316E4B|nr:hypothetical protein [Pedobacter aquatilis]